MKAWVGTSGYSYTGWKGSFYPEKLPASAMLAHYAAKLPAVELNNTFYQQPKPPAVTAWSEQVPEDFRFAVKAAQRITHWKRLVGAEEETRYLLATLEPLGERLGCVLYQLPPNLRADPPRLRAFLELLADAAPQVKAAFEFRHSSWASAEVLELLGRFGCAWVLAETDEEPLAVRLSGAAWGYVRLRRTEYSPEELRDWARRLRDLGWAEAFVFFKHEDAGVGPRLAADLLRRLAEPE
jgi:uncharacterized protein YecE (DUF72 family)